MTRLNLSLYNNAIGFAEDALANAIVAEEVPERWKFAILSLTQSIELSLKELLRRQHPLFIYKNIDNPDLTVGITQAKNRLHKIAGIRFEKTENEALKTASEIRNCIVHHEIDEATHHLKFTFAHLLGFLNDFHTNHLDQSIQNSVESRLWAEAINISEYGDELFLRAKERLAAEGYGSSTQFATCPYCSYASLPARDVPESTCYVCGNIESVLACTRCRKPMLSYDDNLREVATRIYCLECTDHITHDFWHEHARRK